MPRAQCPAFLGFRAVYVFVTQTEGKELPTLTEVQGDVSGYREWLVQFVASQGIELNYSEKIGSAKDLSHGGKITCCLACSPPRNSPRLSMRSATYVAQRFMCRSLLGGLENAPSRADKRHITWRGEAGE
jgi:hypothetical protein